MARTRTPWIACLTAAVLALTLTLTAGVAPAQEDAGGVGPTFKEGGFNVKAAIWRGVITKKGTPKKIVNTLHDAMKKILDDPDYKKFISKRFVLNGYLGGPKAFTKYFRDEVKSLRKHFGKKKK